MNLKYALVEVNRSFDKPAGSIVKISAGLVDIPLHLATHIDEQ